MKKILLFSALMFVLLSSCVCAGQQNIKVLLNDKYIDFTDENGYRVEPTIINDRTMVPMRKVFETLNAKVEWNASTQTVVANSRGKEITLQIGNFEAKVKDVATNESKTIKLDSAPLIIDGRTMVPVRFIAESLGKKVGWDSWESTVIILDIDDMIENLKENCSTFIGMTKEQNENLNSFDLESNFKGTISSKNNVNSGNNVNISLKGTANAKKSGDLSEFSLKLKMSGNEKINNELKEAGYDNIDLIYSMNSKDNKVYCKDSTSWNGYEWEELTDNIPTLILQVINGSFDLDKYIEKIQGKNISKFTYYNVYSFVNSLKACIDNSHITVKDGNTKKYTIKPDKSFVLELLELGSSNIDDDKAEMIIEIEFKDGKFNKAKSDIKCECKNYNSTLNININGDIVLKSCNESVNIDYPKDDELANINQRGYFSFFCTVYDSIQTAIQLKYYELYQEYALGYQGTEIPSHYDIYEEVATGIGRIGNDISKWIVLDVSNGDYTSESTTDLLKQFNGVWFMRTSDGKLAYSGLKYNNAYYYTPSAYGNSIVSTMSDNLIETKNSYTVVSTEKEKGLLEKPVITLKVDDVSKYTNNTQAGFAIFCQEYDELYVQIMLAYYDLYQYYSLTLPSDEMPTSYDIFKEIATGKVVSQSKSSLESEWIKISNVSSDGWFLRTSDGKLAYKGFKRNKGEYYYTPNIFGEKTVTKITEDIIK